MRKPGKHLSRYRSGKLRSLLLACLLPALLPASALPAQTGSLAAPTQEYENCARRLFGVLTYTSWHEGFPYPDSPVIFGIFGELADRKRVEESLKASFSRPLQFRTVTNTQEAARCHVLYLPNATASERRTLLQAIEGKAILSIGEFRGPDWPACMVEFVRPTSKASRNRPTSLLIELNLPPPQTGISFQAPLLNFAAKLTREAR